MTTTCGATRDIHLGDDLGVYSIVCNRPASERNPTCLGEHCYTDQLGRRTRWFGDDRTTGSRFWARAFDLMPCTSPACEAGNACSNHEALHTLRLAQDESRALLALGNAHAPALPDTGPCPQCGSAGRAVRDSFAACTRRGCRRVWRLLDASLANIPPLEEPS